MNSRLSTPVLPAFTGMLILSLLMWLSTPSPDQKKNPAPARENAPPPSAVLDGGDFVLSLRAAAPLTYDHLTGGGAWNDGTNADDGDVRPELEGVFYTCVERISYLVKIEVDGMPTDPVQAIEFDLVFDVNSTGQPGVAHVDVLDVQVNYGQVENGDDGTGVNPGVGGFGLDSAISDDRQSIGTGDLGAGGSTATLVDEFFVPSGSVPFDPVTPAEDLVARIQVDDLEANETIVVRIDVQLDCDPGSAPTGNLLIQFADASVISPVADPINTGVQTIAFKKIADVIGAGDPLPVIQKTVTTLTGACPGSEMLTITVGETVNYCYAITNEGTDPLYDVVVIDDNGTPLDPGDDFLVPLTGLPDLDGDGDEGDLEAGMTVSGSALVMLNTTGTVINKAMVTGNNNANGSNFMEFSDMDDAQVTVLLPPCTDCTVIRTTGTGTVCPGSTQMFASTIDPNCLTPQYLWSVTGDAVLLSDPAATTATVQAAALSGASCSGSYTVNLEVFCPDGCGPETVICTPVMVLIGDDTPPDLTCPPDVTVECNTPTDPMSTGFPISLMDNCDLTLDIEHTDQTTAGACPQEFTITRTWTATDNCSNSSTCDQLITVDDSTPPTIDTPAEDETIECDGAGNTAALDAWLIANGGAAATDLCGTVTWNNTFTGLTAGCGATGNATVTFIASDECGNSSTTTATFTIVDTTPPDITTTASGLTVECDGNDNTAELNDWLNTNGGATATDLCGAVTWSNTFTGLTAGCGATGNATVTFIASDECGNSSTTTATFTIIDTTPPDITTTASGLTVECDGNGNTAELNDWLNTNGGAIATDLCGAVTWSNTFTGLTAGCGATGNATVTFIASDECGNSSSTIATFTIIDTTPPGIDVAASDMTVECDGDGNTMMFNAWLFSNGGAVAGDACSNITWSTMISSTTGCGTTEITTVTFIATDDCGNSSTTIATFTIEDTTPPDITMDAGDLVIECDGTGNMDELDAWLLSNGGAMATDVCGAVNWSNTFTGLTAGCGGSAATTVTFIATDDCGNSSTTTATFTILDETPPAIDVPAADQTVECDGAGNTDDLNAWLISNAGALASDQCNGVTWSNTFTGLTAGCGATGSATVTFIATDACGNSSSTTATFTIEDTTPPNITTTATGLTVECDGDGNMAELDAWLTANGGAAASEECSTVSWSSTFTGLTAGCGATGSATVTFVATDDCGNSSTTTATFTIVDTTPPVLTGVPPDLDVACDAIPPAATVTATDLCSGSLTVNFSETDVVDPTCPASGTITRTWSAMDDCGLMTSATQVITYGDATPPSIDTPAADQTVECNGTSGLLQLLDWLGNNGGATASDGCGMVSWENNYNGLSDGCGGTGAATVTFTASDECGNTSTTTATFTIIDTTPPTITTTATGLTVECDGDGNTEDIMNWLNVSGGAMAVDGCGGVMWTNTFTGLTATCGAAGEAVVTFIATDDCGNTSTTTATITVEDTTPPEITTPAADLMVACDGSGNNMDLSTWLLMNGGAAAEDACGAVTWTNTFTGLSAGCDGNGSTMVTFIATDECGNSSTTSATFTILDEVPPSIDVPAANQTVECDGSGNTDALNAWLNTNGGALAFDNCDGVFWSNTFTGLSAGCGATGSASVTFIATDDCGNSSTTTATFTIADTTPPDITTTATGLTVECDGDGNVAEYTAWLSSRGGAAATDICGEVTWSFLESSVTGCGATGATTVTFIATDDCGNTSTTTAIFTIVDTTAPSIDAEAADATIECDGTGNTIGLNDWLDSNGGAMASDLCGEVTWSNTFTGLAAGCGGSAMTTVTFIASDECGNTSITTATLTIQDTTPPSIDTEAGDQTIECNGTGNMTELDAWLLANGGATASDECNGVSWTNTFTGLTVDACGATGSATVTFIASDACGNSSTTTATFTIKDTTPPAIDTEAADLVVECDGDGNTTELDNWLISQGGAMSSDQCGDVIWSSTYTGLTADGCGATGSATVTFIATDECGNSSTTTATFTIEDTTPPAITTTASGLTVECDGAGNMTDYEAWLTSNGGAEASDICGDVSWSFMASSFTGCGATGATTVTFIASDECGNTSTTTATFTIEDTTPPTIDNDASDLMVECDGIGNTTALDDWLASQGGATASDLCGAVTWTNTFTGLTAGCGGSAMTTVTFIASDACGNTSTTTASLTILDTTPPDIDTDAADLTVECDGAGNLADLNAWLTGNGGATASDECNGVTWRNTFTGLSAGCGATGSATVTFIATDACGNSSTTTATFTIEDTTAPELTAGATDLTVECDGMGNNAELTNWLAANGGASATDDCSDVTWTSTFTGLTAGCGATGNATVTFIASDDCGNSSTTTATFTIVDTTPPTFEVEGTDLTAECDGTGNLPELNNWLQINEAVSAVDLCSEVSLSSILTTLTGACTGTETRILTFTATDDCGNSSLTTATFTLEDTTPPDITTTATGLTVECDGSGNTADLNAWLASRGGAVATDACSSVTWSYDPPVLSDDCGATGSTTVTFTATDQCGNSATTTATFVIEDTTPPDLTTSAGNLTANCNTMDVAAELDNWLTTNGGATANDQCGSVNWSSSFTGLTAGCGATPVTFVATDECGNSAATTAIFAVIDDVPPFWTNEPMDMTVACDGSGNVAQLQAWLDAATATDNCGVATVTDDFSGLTGDCGATGSTTVNFTATDICGNSISKQVTFTIEDTTDPFWINEPVDLTVECDGNGNAAELNAWLNGFTAGDLCSTAAVYHDFSGLSDDCGKTGSALVTFTATDECGRFITKQALFTIEDTTPPTVTCPPDVEVDCSVWTPDYDAGLATASDLCSGVMLLNFSDMTIPGSCSAEFTIQRTWTASDSCSTSASCTQLIQVVDNTPPQITTALTDLTVECDGTGNQAEFDAWLMDLDATTATDDCGVAFLDSDFSELIPVCGGAGSATVTFIATDECGNTATTTAVFTIEDTTPPVQIADCPQGLTGLGSFDEVPPPDPAAVAAVYEDACGEVIVEFAYSYTAGTECTAFNIHYFFNVYDECGNQAAGCEVVHSGVNPYPLTGTCPEGNKKLTCPDEVPPPDEDWVASHYNGNGTVTATLNNIIELGDPCTGFTVIHEYLVADDCTTQLCKVIWEGLDNYRPTGICPLGLTDLVCISDIPDPDPVGVAAGYSDNCTLVTATLISVETDTSDCSSFSLTYEYLVADDCANFTTCTVTHSGIGTDCPDCDDGPTRPGTNAIIANPQENRQDLQPADGIRREVHLPTTGEADLELYPNPTSGVLMVSLPPSIVPERLSIQDLQGRLLFSTRIDKAGFTRKIELNLGELGIDSGTYFLRVESEGQSINRKFIVNRP